MDAETALYKRRWETSEDIRNGMNNVIQKQLADIKLLRAALTELADEAFKNMAGGKGHLLDNAYAALQQTE